MIVGIDLGTTNSLIAYYDGTDPVVIPNRLGEYLPPSVISVDAGGEVYIGKTALERSVTHPHESVSVFKRSMGTERVFRLGEREFSATRLSGLILSSLKEDAESFLGHIVELDVPFLCYSFHRKGS